MLYKIVGDDIRNIHRNIADPYELDYALETFYENQLTQIDTLVCDCNYAVCEYAGKKEVVSTYEIADYVDMYIGKDGVNYAEFENSKQGLVMYDGKRETYLFISPVSDDIAYAIMDKLENDF